MKQYGTGLSFTILALVLYSSSFNANAQQSVLQLQVDVSSITSVKAYCAYLDKSIPNAFKNYIGFMQTLDKTTGQENLKNADLAARWESLLKSNSEIWGSLGCEQLIYGVPQGKSR